MVGNKITIRGRSIRSDIEVTINKPNWQEYIEW